MAVLKKPVPSSILDAINTYPEAVAVSIYFAVYGLVIAILKDVPDIIGDKKFNIMSLSVRKGGKYILQ